MLTCRPGAGLRRYHEALGDGSGSERSFSSLKRIMSAFFKGMDAGRSRIASLDRIIDIFFAYHDGLRFQEGMGRLPSYAIAILRDPLIRPSPPEGGRFVLLISGAPRGSSTLFR